MDETTTTTTLEGPITKPDGQPLHPTEDAPVGTTMVSTVDQNRRVAETAATAGTVSIEAPVASNELPIDNEPRARMMTRPAPVPPGYTSLELPDHGV